MNRSFLGEKSMNKVLLSTIFAYSIHIFSEGSVIILYGGSSAGKTSTAQALGKILPGKWRVLGIDMFSNKNGSANEQLWDKIGKDVAAGYNVVADTVSSKFLTRNCKGAKLFIVVMYCSPFAMLDHVQKRNQSENKREHRTIDKVLRQYCSKHMLVQKDSKKHIDILHESDLKEHPYHRKLKQVKSRFFEDGNSIAYIATSLMSYNFVINTGNNTISECALKIKKAFCDQENLKKQI